MHPRHGKRLDADDHPCHLTGGSAHNRVPESPPGPHGLACDRPAGGRAINNLVSRKSGAVQDSGSWTIRLFRDVATLVSLHFFDNGGPVGSKNDFRAPASQARLRDAGRSRPTGLLQEIPRSRGNVCLGTKAVSPSLARPPSLLHLSLHARARRRGRVVGALQPAGGHQ